MDLEIIDNKSLTDYMKIWKSAEWEMVTYDDLVLNPDCLAFGVREQGRPEALVIAELINGYADIKMLEFNSHNALKELLNRFSGYCHSLNIKKVKYTFRIQEVHEKNIKDIMTDNGWNEPQVKYRIFEVKKDSVPLSQKTRGNRPKGVIVPFFETTQKQRLDMVLKLTEDSCFYRMENLIDSLCLAYVENDVINGFVLVEYKDDGIYIEMDKMSAEPVVIANLITECADKVLENGIYKVYIRVKAKYGEQVVRNVFLNQIINSELITFEE